MSEQDDNANRVAGVFPHLLDGWASAMAHGAVSLQKSPDMPTGAVDPRAVRRQWCDQLGLAADQYLRSPAFLHSLKAHLDILVEAKRAEDSPPDATSAADGQLAEDIRATRQRLEQLEQELLRLRAMADLGGDAGTAAAPWSDAPELASQALPAESESRQDDTPYEVVYQRGTLRLLRYRTQKARYQEPILICFALVNRPYILDLQPDRSVVRRLLERGFEVYLIDWGTPGEADCKLRLDDYVDSMLGDVVEFVCTHSKAERLSLLGYCMGGTMATMYTALAPRRVGSLILMATPIDFAIDSGLLNLWARDDHFDVDKLIDAFGNCPGEFLKFAFQLMKPVQNFAEKQLTFCENLDDAAFVGSFVALERWASDSIPVAGETFRQYVKILYQQNQLVRGEMVLAGQTLRLDKIDCPLLMLVADKDHLVPPESTLALSKYVSSKEVRTMSIDAGHVGLAVSSKAHRHLWPGAAGWIANHSTEI